MATLAARQGADRPRCVPVSVLRHARRKSYPDLSRRVKPTKLAPALLWPSWTDEERYELGEEPERRS